MFKPAFTSLRHAALALALSACASLASAASVFQIEIDTSSLVAANGNTGWIDLQFNPGNGGTPYAQAALSNFFGFGDAASAEVAGNVSGSLAGGYVIGNDDAGGYNDLFHAVNFGGKVGFTVSFSGDLDPTASTLGSAFSVSLLNHNQDTALGTNDPVGALVWLNWTSLGSITATPLTNTIATSVSAVPEAETWLMLGAGLALVGGLARRRRLAA
jgi:hypothetical protein